MRPKWDPVCHQVSFLCPHQKWKRSQKTNDFYLGSWTYYYSWHIGPLSTFILPSQHWLELVSPVPPQTVSTTSIAGKPAVVESVWRAAHLCFVCIIKETRSKLMERYSPKLLRRKRGTMSNLRSLHVSVPPQC